MKIDNKTLVSITDEDIIKGECIIPQGVERLERDLFVHNRQIKTIYFPSSLKAIDEKCFYNAINLKNVYFYNDEKDISKIKNTDGGIYFDEYNNIEDIECLAFAYSGLQKFYLSKNLKNIDSKVFIDSGVKELYISPEINIKELKSHTFNQMNLLKTLIIPKGVKEFSLNEEDLGSIKTLIFEGVPNYKRNFYINFSTSLKEYKIYFNGYEEFEEKTGKLTTKNVKTISNKLYPNLIKVKGNNLYVLDNNEIKEINLKELKICGEKVGFENYFSIAVEGKGAYLYEALKIFEKHEFSCELPKELFDVVNTKEQLESFILTKKSNKIWRNIENKIKAFGKTFHKTPNYMLGAIRIAFYLGAFNQDKKLSQKVCDFIYHDLLQEEGIYKFSTFELFKDLETRMNNNGEEFFKFIKTYLKDIENLNHISEGRNSSYENFMVYLHDNFDSLKSLCKSAKKEFNFNNCYKLFSKQKLGIVTVKNKEIIAELKKFEQADESAVKFVEKIKEQIIKEKVPQNLFMPFNENDLKDIYSEKLLENKLTGFTETGFSYAWINKYKTKNLTLAKQDNTGCGNLFGIGSGIAVASMVDKNCQTVRICDSYGKGIAKATLILNRDKGEILFNTFMIKKAHLISNAEKNNVIECLKEATFAFINEYEKNFPKNKKIKKVYVGDGFESLPDYIRENEIPFDEIMQGINFKNYSYSLDLSSNWNGDWERHQYEFLSEYEIEENRQNNKINNNNY